MPPSRIILGGDVGGTKVSLAAYRHGPEGRLELLRAASYPTGAYGALEEVLRVFLAGETTPHAAGFGVAGPVDGPEARLTNRPWHIRAASLREVLRTDRILLVNDMQAMAYGTLFLPEDSMQILQRGEDRGGSRAVIAAGTGLGTGLLVRAEHGFVPVPSEGGHVDFGPRSDLEVALLRHVAAETGRASYERIVSGPGLVRIYRFLAGRPGRQPNADLLRQLEATADGDGAAVIGTAALEARCPVAIEAVSLFMGIYGAQAGNLALTTLATGGLYVGGGIAVRLRRFITRGEFVEAFRDKDPHRGIMERIPVRLLLDPHTARLGAAYLAAS